jgi:hypothetical protein
MKRKTDTTVRDFVAFGLFALSTPWIFYFIGEVFA